MTDDTSQVAAPPAQATENPPQAGADTAKVNTAATGQAATGGSEGNINPSNSAPSAGDTAESANAVNALDHPPLSGAALPAVNQRSKAVNAVPEETLIMHLEEWLKSAEIRFKNSMQVIKMHLEAVLPHLKDHVKNQKKGK